VGNAKVQQRVQTMDFAAISTFVTKNPAGIMSFLGGGVIAWGLGLLWTHMIVRPVISVRLDDKRGCSGTMPIFTNIDGKQERYDAKFIRLQVENTGLSTIKDCCGYITKLTKRTDTGNVIQQEAVFPLGWAYHPHSDARNIPPGVFFYMDVVQLHLFQTGERELRPPYPPTSLVEFFRDKGTYKVEILIAADNAHRRKIAVEFICDPQHDCLKAESLNRVRYPLWRWWRWLRSWIG
jgi:hypothetical protein